MSKLKIVFMGTPEFSVNVLQGLIENYDVIGVVTQPDKEVGRKHEIRFSPVKELALKNDIRVYQPAKIKMDYQELLKLPVDMIVTCAYGQILPKELLDYPKYGCINVHASLLPKLRGGAPIHRAIINGYSKTGVTIMFMAPGMDDGDIITQKEIKIDDIDTASTLHDKLSKLGSELLIETLPNILNNNYTRIPQDSSKVTFASIIKPEDEKLDFSKTTIQIYNQIRGLNSFPGAYFILDGKRFKVWESIITNDYASEKINGEIVKIYKQGIGVKTSNGIIILTIIQPEGKSRMKSVDYINGLHENIVGKIIG